MAEKAEIQGMIVDLERIKKMSDEELQTVQQQLTEKNEQLDQDLASKMAELNEGELNGVTRNRKAKDYVKTIAEVEKIIGQIEANQKLIEVYVNARVEKGNFADLGIENMNDFINASGASIDLSIKENEGEIEELNDARKINENNKELREINNMILEKKNIEVQIENNNIKIEEYQKKIDKNLDKIKQLEEELENAKPEDKKGIADKIKALETENKGFGDSIEELRDSNTEMNSRLDEIKSSLEEIEIDFENEDELNKIFEKNNSEIEKNDAQMQIYSRKYNIPLHDNEMLDEDIDTEVEAREGEIEDLNSRKEQLNRTEERVEEEEREEQAGQQQEGQQQGGQQQAGQQRGGQQQGGNFRGNGQGNPNYNLPANYQGNIFKRLYNGIKDRFEPQTRARREEFVKCEHPDWDESMVRKIANSKDKRGELNELIEKGISPQVYAQTVSSETSKLNQIEERINNVSQRGSVISEQVSQFDAMLKDTAKLTPKEKKRMEIIKQQTENAKNQQETEQEGPEQ